MTRIGLLKRGRCRKNAYGQSQAFDAKLSINRIGKSVFSGDSVTAVLIYMHQAESQHPCGFPVGDVPMLTDTPNFNLAFYDL